MKTRVRAILWITILFLIISFIKKWWLNVEWRLFLDAHEILLYTAFSAGELILTKKLLIFIKGVLGLLESNDSISEFNTIVRRLIFLNWNIAGLQIGYGILRISELYPDKDSRMMTYHYIALSVIYAAIFSLVLLFFVNSDEKTD